MIPDWISQFWQPGWLALLGSITLLSLVAAVLMAPWLAALIPADYFSENRKHGFSRQRGKGLLAWIRTLLRNLLGLLVMLLGLIMLFTPGQGILMLFLASMLLDYPGKLRFQRWMVERKGVLQGVNWLRKKAGAVPLELHPN